jgi:predicted nuclease of restriction endonuclease-like RecB superfamily
MSPTASLPMSSTMSPTTQSQSMAPRISPRLYVEVLGFWTTEFVARKLALYRDAGIDDVVICIDDSRACTKDDLPEHPRVLHFHKRVTTLASPLLSLLALEQ